MDAILLPLAGEGADRRMRVDQYSILINLSTYEPTSPTAYQSLDTIPSHVH
jgi:hypothetical protein